MQANWKKLVAGLVLLLSANTVSAQEKITVFAAASLAGPLTEASAQFEQAKGLKVSHSFASSATLAKQIAAGAPADVFISANTQWMDYLQARGRIQHNSRQNWLGNRLVLVAPLGQGFPVQFEPDYDIAASIKGRLCTGNVESVPVGIYAKQALAYLSWWGDLKSRIVGAEDVRSALAFVERGECAAGIVYESDARISDKVQLAGVFPPQSHEPIVYPIALVAGAGNRSRDYWQFLQSPAAQAVFARHGFRLLN